MPRVDGLLADARWPARDLGPVDEEAEADVGAAIDAVKSIRGWRDGLGVRPGAVLPCRLAGYGAMSDHIARLARLEWRDGTSEEPVARYPYPRGMFEVFATDEVDFGAETRRAAERRAKLQAEIERAERKLSNEKFVERAKPEVVQAERDKLATLRAELEELG